MDKKYTVQVIMSDGTVVKKTFKSENKAQEFAAECRAHTLVSMVIVRSK